MNPLILLGIAAAAFILGVGVAVVMMRQTRAQFSEHFRSLSLDALQSNSKTFVEIARGELEKTQLSAKSDLEKRQVAIDEIVKPVRQSLEKLDVKIHDLENARTGAYASLTEQVRSLADTQ